MPYLPPLLAEIPLRVSFVPMRGCVHFCSFCADNSGIKVQPFSIEAVKKTILSYPYPLKSAALYNACDALAYRWQAGKRLYTVLDIIESFKKRGCRELLLSSPGIGPESLNKTIIKTVAADDAITLMLSFNREHALHEERMRNFFWTAKAILAHRRLVVRLIYCSPGEKKVLYGELERVFGKEILCDPLTKKGITVETVPVAPLGRGRGLYFQNSGNDADWQRRTESMILTMFRDEKELRELRYIAAGSYADFLQHAAVQFSGMFIFLLVPGEDGGELVLKATDVEKAVRTQGVSIATSYRYNPTLKKFERTARDGSVAALDGLLLDSRKCSLHDFIRFIDNRIPPGEKQTAGRMFSAIMASDIVNEKCAVNDSMRMIFLNDAYLAYLQKAFESLMDLRGVPPRLVRRFFPVIMEYLQRKGEVI